VADERLKLVGFISGVAVALEGRYDNKKECGMTVKKSQGTGEKKLRAGLFF
jgi:hypothetical protein